MDQVIQVKVTVDKLSLINIIIYRLKRNRMNTNYVCFKIEIIGQEKQLKIKRIYSSCRESEF